MYIEGQESDFHTDNNEPMTLLWNAYVSSQECIENNGL